jgi:hypothetical protein
MTTKSKLIGMDNILLVVDDLEAVKAFFIELGMVLEGEATVEGPLIGLENVRATLAMLRFPDGHAASNWISITRPNRSALAP